MANTLLTGGRGRSPSWPGARLLAGAAVLLLVASATAWVMHRDSGSVGTQIVAFADAVDAELATTDLALSGDRSRGNEVRVDRVPLPPVTLRTRFETSDDLYAYAQSLEPALRERDADAIWMVSRVYDYCSSFAMAPAAYDRDTGVIRDMAMRGSAAMVAARERVARRCARFVPQDELTPRMVVLKRTEAAEAGSLAAEASLMAGGQPLDDTPEYKRDLVDRVQRSGDPEAYSALSPAMGIAASGEPAVADRVAGTQMSELAWQLAACRLGQDCGPESSMMTSYCANGGICSRDPAQDFERFVFDAAVPRQSADLLNEMIDSLIGGKRAEK